MTFDQVVPFIFALGLLDRLARRRKRLNGGVEHLSGAVIGPDRRRQSTDLQRTGVTINYFLGDL